MNLARLHEIYLEAKARPIQNVACAGQAQFNDVIEALEETAQNMKANPEGWMPRMFTAQVWLASQIAEEMDEDEVCLETLFSALALGSRLDRRWEDLYGAAAELETQNHKKTGLEDLP